MQLDLFLRNTFFFSFGGRMEKEVDQAETEK